MEAEKRKKQEFSDLAMIRWAVTENVSVARASSAGDGGLTAGNAQVVLARLPN